jgi:hypothetical protein
LIGPQSISIPNLHPQSLAVQLGFAGRVPLNPASTIKKTLRCRDSDEGIRHINSRFQAALAGFLCVVTNRHRAGPSESFVSALLASGSHVFTNGVKAFGVLLVFRGIADLPNSALTFA